MGDRVPATDENFDEAGYLMANPDVEQAVRSGFFPSGRRHFELHGRNESRELVLIPSLSRKQQLAGRIGLRRTSDAVGLDRVESIEERVYALETALTQLTDVISYDHGTVPPPKHLQERVVGSYNGNFIRSGFVTVYPQLNRALATDGRKLEDFAKILDFGCGCGRVLFALNHLLTGSELHGTDIDPEAIGWLQTNWSDIASYTVCPLEPPMDYADSSFDFVYGISVVTHLPEDLQLAWLAELSRVTQPGGYVLLTTHGEHAWRGQLDAEQLEIMKQVGFLYTKSGYGASIGLPDFYETAFHSHDYVRRVWKDYFDVINIWEPEPGEHQDTVLLKRRS